MIALYGYFRSSSSYRCRIAFNLKGVAFDYVPVHLLKGGGEHKSEAFKALNPQGLVPAVKADDALLTQSLAILEWLEETHPEPPLLPSDPIERAHVRAFCAAIACEIQPFQNLRTLNFIKDHYGQDQAGVTAWCRHWIGDGLAACEGLLAQRDSNTAFCFGDAPGLADAYLVPQVFSADRFGVDLTQMPRVVEIAKRCNEMPAFIDAHPANQPDAE